MYFSKTFNKNIDRFHYLTLLITLNTGYFITTILWLYYSLFPFKGKRKTDIIFFPYAQPGSDGYKRRFEVYLPHLKKENISFIMCDITDNKHLIENLEGSKLKRYILFRKIYFKRIRQVLLARKCKAAFVQRGLFVAFPDQKFPHLERLLSKLNTNITIDFWDSFWLYNKKLVDKAASYCNKISCVNEFDQLYFNFLPQPKLLFPIGIDLSPYKQKKDYAIHGPVKFVYTGLPHNVEQFLSFMSPVFEKLIKEIDFKLILITRYRNDHLPFPAEFHYFEESTFYNLLSGADIGLYAVEESDESKGKMATKVLDYMAAGLPSVASPYGLTPYAQHNENILVASGNEEFYNTITKLVSDIDLRTRIGKSAFQTMIKHHEIEKSYSLFKQIVFESPE